MGFGSTVAVEEAEEQWRRDCAKVIKREAAKHVGARTMTREEAIKAETELLRQECEAENDVTRTLETMIVPPKPSKAIKEQQIRAIAAELDEAATAASKTL